MTKYSDTPVAMSEDGPPEIDPTGKKVLIASTLDAGHTRLTGTIDFVGALAASFDFTPDKFAGAMVDLGAREWEIFLEEEPEIDIKNKVLAYRGEGGSTIWNVAIGWRAVSILFKDGSSTCYTIAEFESGAENAYPKGFASVRSLIREGKMEIIGDLNPNMGLKLLDKETSNG